MDSRLSKYKEVSIVKGGPNESLWDGGTVSSILIAYFIYSFIRSANMRYLP